MASYVHAVASPGVGSAGSTYPATMPSGIVAGDVIAVAINLRDSTAWAHPPTAPAGWTAHGHFGTTDGGLYGLAVFSKVAAGSEGATVAFPCQSGSALHGSAVAIRDVNHASVQIHSALDTTGTATSHTAPSYIASGPGMQVVFATHRASGGVWSNGDSRIAGPNLNQPMIATKTIPGPGSTAPAPTLSYNNTSRAVSVVLGFTDKNLPPNAPTLTSLTGGVSVNRENTNRASWVFSDPNFTDSQSKFDLRYRIVGAPTWATVTKTTPNAYHDFAGGSLSDADYEWQVRTYDALGLVGPYSASGFFTAGDPPSGPTITSPLNGSTAEKFTPVTWSTPDQESYQVRRVADDAGTPDTDTIYYDSGEVAEPSTRTVTLDFPVNARTEHVQLRIKDAGIWSPWSTVQVEVSYAPPTAPLVEIHPDPGTGSLLLRITNPAPGDGDVAAIYNDVLIDDGHGEERKATNLSTNTDWRYWTPRSGRDYSASIRVVAVAASGASTSSEGLS